MEQTAWMTGQQHVVNTELSLHDVADPMAW